MGQKPVSPLLGPVRRGMADHCSKQGAELPRCTCSLFLSLQLAALVATIFDAPLLAPYASQLAPVRAAEPAAEPACSAGAAVRC